MAIRQIVSRAIKDGEIVDADVNASGFSSGSGFFQGENGSTTSASKKGDIFRVNEATLNTNITIASGDNASCAGPLTVASGITLTVASGGRFVAV
jgi:hypothetical protein